LPQTFCCLTREQTRHHQRCWFPSPVLPSVKTLCRGTLPKNQIRVGRSFLRQIKNLKDPGCFRVHETQCQQQFCLSGPKDTQPCAANLHHSRRYVRRRISSRPQSEATTWCTICEESTASVSLRVRFTRLMAERTSVSRQHFFFFTAVALNPRTYDVQNFVPCPLTPGLLFCAQQPKQPINPVPVGGIVGIVIAALLLVGLVILWVYLYKTGRLKADKCCRPRDPAPATAVDGTHSYRQAGPAASAFPAPSVPPATAAHSEMSSVPAGTQNVPGAMVASVPVAVAAPYPAPEPEHPSSPPPSYKTPAKHWAKTGASVDESSPTSGSSPPPTYKTPAKHRAKAGASVDDSSPASGSSPPPNYKTPAKGWAQQATGNPDGESPASDGAPPPTYKTPAKGWA